MMNDKQPTIKELTNKNSQTDSNLEVLEQYNQHSTLRALASMLPLGAAADIKLQAKLDEMRKKRAKIFFDELNERSTPLTREEIESEDFLHKYFSTVKYVLNTRRGEKIRMFARLLSNSETAKLSCDIDRYEDFLKILDELSYKELCLLNIYDEFTATPRNDGTIPLEPPLYSLSGNFKEKVFIEAGIPGDELACWLKRLERTGCYTPFPTSHAENNPYNFGHVTRTYHKLKDYIVSIKTP